MTNPDSKYIEQLAAGYVVGDLTPSEAEEFQQLLTQNPDLAVEVDCLQDVLDQTLWGLNEVKPPPELDLAILASARSDLNTENVIQKKISHFPWRKIVGSVAALLILYLGIDNYRLRNDVKLAQETNTLLQHSQTRLFPLEGTQLAKTATGSFVVNLNRAQGIIALQNLPQPPVGSVYRLWAVIDGDKIPCGQLSTIREGKVVQKFSMPADFYDDRNPGFLVTLESPGDHRYPTGAVVIQSSQI